LKIENVKKQVSKIIYLTKEEKLFVFFVVGCYSQSCQNIDN